MRKILTMKVTTMATAATMVMDSSTHSRNLHLHSVVVEVVACATMSIKSTVIRLVPKARKTSDMLIAGDAVGAAIAVAVEAAVVVIVVTAIIAVMAEATVAVATVVSIAMVALAEAVAAITIEVATEVVVAIVGAVTIAAAEAVTTLDQQVIHLPTHAVSSSTKRSNSSQSSNRTNDNDF